jgi:hypothetical protein
MRRAGPYRGENPGPARMLRESLNRGPELENTARVKMRKSRSEQFSTAVPYKMDLVLSRDEWRLRAQAAPEGTALNAFDFRRA